MTPDRRHPWPRRLARRLGYELTPLRKPKALDAQLVQLLAHHRIARVLDVGANRGQYAMRLRREGFAGTIVSFEPQGAAHAALMTAAASDSAWLVAPPMALGAEAGEAEIEVSAESDMSSLLPQQAWLREISPSSRITARETVAVQRLDALGADLLGEGERLFLKIDTQGYEASVLEGAKGLLPALIGIQLELSLVPLYQGEPDYRQLIARLDAAGFALHLVLPGYFERKLARQLQFDGVFVRR